MALILHIETSGEICSVAVSENGVSAGLKKTDAVNDHASRLTTLIAAVIGEAGYKLNDLSAVAVSAGPGSYTGLRIGTSTAKGLCHGLNIPLIAVSTLRCMADGKSSQQPSDMLYCPAIDAKRMEIFTAIYSADGNEIIPPCSMVLMDDSFMELLKNHKILFFGSGAPKIQSLISHSNALFDLVHEHHAGYLIKESYRKYNAKEFADLLYFEPEYLKEVYTTISKKDVS